MGLINWFQANAISWVAHPPQHHNKHTQTETEEWQMIGTDDARPGYAEKYQRMIDTYGVMASLRSELMLLQSKATYEIQTGLYAHQHMQQSAEDIVAQLADSKDKHDANLDPLIQQLASDGMAFQTQARTTMESLVEEKNKQWRLAKSEAEFNQALEALIIALPKGRDMWENMQHAQQLDTSKPQNNADEEIPSLAQDYFEAAGLLNNLRERLDDTHREHIEERVQRNQLQDQEKELSTTDSQFESRHTTEVTAINEQIDEAMRKAQDLLQECEQNGIDVESLRQEHTHHLDDLGSDFSPIFAFDPESHDNDSRPGVGQPAIGTTLTFGATSNDDTNNNNGDARVEAWLGQSATTTTEMPPHHSDDAATSVGAADGSPERSSHSTSDTP